MLNRLSGTVAEISSTAIGLFVVVILVVLIWKLFVRLWLYAKFSDVPMTFVELIGMTLRKVNAKRIVISLIIAKKVGLDLQREQLEVHSLCGGDISKVVRAMIALDRAGLNPEWETLTREDLQGIDVLEEAQLAVQRIRDNENDYDDQSIEKDEFE